jgi:hypothetical protein
MRAEGKDFSRMVIAGRAETTRQGKATATVKNAAEACYFRCRLPERRNFNTLPGMSRVSLRTAIVASRPIARNSAKKITATIRTGINHPGGIVRRRHWAW